MVVARRVGVAVLLAGILAAAACSSDAPQLPSAAAATSTFSSYVALGDSYAAGPGIAPVDPQSGTCLRSINNWPTLLAKDLHIPSFKDVTCTGATSDDVINPHSASVTEQLAPQMDAVTASTDLVTLEVGGNDEGVFGRTIVWCASPELNRGLCSPQPKDQLKEIMVRTTSRVALAIERIRDRAPGARIVLVGYLRTLSEPGGCVTPGLTAAKAETAAAGQRAIDAALAAAAKRAKVDYISLSSASVGHESCSGKAAWVNGMAPTPGDGAYLHPSAAGMRAVAGILSKRLAAASASGQ